MVVMKTTRASVTIKHVITHATYGICCRNCNTSNSTFALYCFIMNEAFGMLQKQEIPYLRRALVEADGAL